LASREGLGKIAFNTKGLPWKYFAAKYPRKGVKKKFMGIGFELIHKMRLEKRLMLG
jgi:hypothetical protein